MSGPSRMDMFRLAGRTVDTALQAWGVSQEQRRTAEFNKATADAREGYRQLLQDIEKENDYTQHEVMFNRGVSEIRKTVGDQWLGDPYVRTRFDAQWSGMTQAARGTAMNYSWAAEKSALQVEMFNQIKDFFQSSLENAHTNARGLINEYYEAGIIDPRVEEQAWEYYRQQGQHALKARVDAAVEARDPERVEQLYTAATEGSIIEDPELAANMKAADLYEIKVGATTDVAMAVYNQQGIDAAVTWLQNPDNEYMSALESEDQIRVTRSIREFIGFRRSEEDLAARKLDEAYMSKSVDIETSIQEGESTWSAGLTWLREQETRDSLTDQHWRQLYDRWEFELEQEQRPVSGSAGTQIASSHAYADLLDMIDAGADWSVVSAIARDYMRGDDPIFSRSDWESIQKYNSDRPLLAEDESGIRAMISDVVAERNENGAGMEITEYRINQLEKDLTRNLNSLRFAPDGTEYTKAEQDAHKRSFILARLRGAELEQGRWFWTRDISNEDLITAAQERRLYGLFDERTMTETMTALQRTDMTAEEQSEYLRNRLFAASEDHELSALELNQRDAFEQLAQVNEQSQERFAEDFETQPSNLGMTTDGLAYFTRIETEPDGSRVERAYQLQVHNGEYQWRQYNRVGDRDVWVPFNPIEEREEADAAEERRAAYLEGRANQAEAIAVLQPDIDPARVGTQADGTLYENAAIDTAKGQPNEDDLHHATILLLAQPMMDMREIQLSNKDQAVYSRVHSALANPDGGITPSDFDEILKIITHYMPDWQQGVEERTESGEARDFREQLSPMGNNR